MDAEPITCPKCGSADVTRWKPPPGRPYRGSTVVYQCPCGMGFTNNPPGNAAQDKQGGDGGSIPKSGSYERDVPLG